MITFFNSQVYNVGMSNIFFNKDIIGQYSSVQYPFLKNSEHWRVSKKKVFEPRGADASFLVKWSNLIEGEKYKLNQTIQTQDKAEFIHTEYNMYSKLNQAYESSYQKELSRLTKSFA